MTKFYAKFESINSKLGMVELSTSTGEWAGSFRVDARRGVSLKDSAYAVADREATLKGGRLEALRVRVVDVRKSADVVPSLRSKRSPAVHDYARGESRQARSRVRRVPLAVGRVWAARASADV